MRRELRHMARAGKTFFFASLWLDRDTRDHAAIAYSFCRMVDDLADELPVGEKRSQALDALRNALVIRDRQCLDAAGMITLMEKFPEIAAPSIGLLDACKADIPGLLLEGEDDLIAYAHGVAGNVGLLMYPMLGGVMPEGRRHADALGIAMQCTNIARDIIPDFIQGRCYLPREWLQGVTVEDILSGKREAEIVVVDAVRRLLAVASRYYHCGLDGLQYLSPRSRFAIRIAADCYEAIGSLVICDQRLVRRRAVVSVATKCRVLIQASLRGSRSYRTFAHSG